MCGSQEPSCVDAWKNLVREPGIVLFGNQESLCLRTKSRPVTYVPTDVRTSSLFESRTRCT